MIVFLRVDLGKSRLRLRKDAYDQGRYARQRFRIGAGDARLSRHLIKIAGGLLVG
jgi:hypothetical protein